jgi:beta-galactosidase
MRTILSFVFFCAFANAVYAQQPQVKKLLYGVAYYDEYMPYERPDKDVQMMKEAGVNVVRIAESTWSTVQPQDALTGTEISFCGDVSRSVKQGKNYLVLETEAQGFPQWLPYPGLDFHVTSASH